MKMDILVMALDGIMAKTTDVSVFFVQGVVPSDRVIVIVHLHRSLATPQIICQQLLLITQRIEYC